MKITHQHRLITALILAISVLAIIHFALPILGAVGWLFMVVLLFDAWLDYWMHRNKSQLSQRTQKIFLWTFYLSVLVFILLILAFWISPIAHWTPFLRVYGYGLILVVISLKIVLASLLFLQFLASKISVLKKFSSPKCWFRGSMWILALALVVMLYGTVYEAFNLRVRRVEVQTEAVPKAFDGYRIVQFSDMHIGSQVWEFYVRRLVDSINAQNPDIVVFTGDMLNFYTEEIVPFIPLFSKIQAKDGVFAVLGNHDYGGYLNWRTPQDSIDNLQRLIDIYHSMGWRVLLNEHVWLHRGEDSIALAGVENYSSPRTRRWKNLANTQQALEGVSPTDFIVMLSHNPEHFRRELKPYFPHVNLTLAAHSHGGQIAIGIRNFKFSISNFAMRYWRGLYQIGDQFLHVDTGSGFNILPFRVNMPPSISVITLSAQ